MKKRIRILTAAAIACCALAGLSASAADERVGTVVDGSLLTEEASAEATVYPLARGSILSNGTGQISIIGVRKIAAGGTTNAHRAVDRVEVRIFVQKLTGNTWVNAITVPSKTLYNTYYVSQAKTYSVTGGYYYRVKGAHIAVDGDIYESVSSATDGIWVD